MASAGPREDEKIDDWVNQMDTILGNLGQVVQIVSSGLFQCQHVFFFWMSLFADSFTGWLKSLVCISAWTDNCCCFKFRSCQMCIECLYIFLCWIMT